MSTVFTVIVFFVVLAGLAVGIWALFQLSPFARHQEQFRDPLTGRRRGDSPRLD
jgi:hypothetical protein